MWEKTGTTVGEFDLKFIGICFLIIVPKFVWGQAAFSSKAQMEYLSDLAEYPPIFSVPTKDAPTFMHRAEGYLAKNMAHFYHVSSYAIQAQIGSVYLNVSRIDLEDGTSEIELVPSVEKTRRGYGVAGTVAAGSILAGKHKNKEAYALTAMALGFMARQAEKQLIKKDLRFAERLCKVTTKFMITGEPYPSSSIEEILGDNLHSIKVTTKPEVSNLKLVKTYKIDEDQGILKIYTKLRSSAFMKKATHLAFNYDKKGTLVSYSLYK